MIKFLTQRNFVEVKVFTHHNTRLTDSGNYENLNVLTQYNTGPTQGNFKNFKVLTHHNAGPTHMYGNVEKTKFPYTTTQGSYENITVLTQHNTGRTHKEIIFPI